MKPESHKLQQDPPEGDREVIERELERRKKDELAELDRKAMDEAAPQTGVRPGP
jgi:hypothetical protein